MAIDGNYEISASTPMGKQTITLKLVTNGDSLSGSATSMMGTDDFTGGTVNGDNITFTVTTRSPMGKINLEFKGAVNGDHISGEVKTPFGPSAFEGSRV